MGDVEALCFETEACIGDQISVEPSLNEDCAVFLEVENDVHDDLIWTSAGAWLSRDEAQSVVDKMIEVLEAYDEAVDGAPAKRREPGEVCVLLDSSDLGAGWDADYGVFGYRVGQLVRVVTARHYDGRYIVTNGYGSDPYHITVAPERLGDLP